MSRAFASWLADVRDDVRDELDRQGISESIGQDACFETVKDMREAFPDARGS